MSELPGARPPRPDHDEGSPRVVISGLNRTAFDLAVYASQGWSPTHHARLRFRLLVRLYRTGLVTRRVPSERFQASAILLSRASWHKVRPFLLYRVPLRIPSIALRIPWAMFLNAASG